VILQKNCHEFISYENLVGIQSVSRKSVGKVQVTSTSALENALPLIRRALKVLSDREVSPQLGLLKSTLLQLDSTFSERDFGVSSFRDFIQKLADAGHVNLKQVDRSLMVELKETSEVANREPQISATPIPEATVEIIPPEQPEAQPSVQSSEAVNALEELLRDSKVKPHWPMYLRTFKQFLRSLQPPFDERQYGFSSTYELVRQAHRDGLIRVERNRQGILRIYPAERFPRIAPEQPVEAAEPGMETPAPAPAVPEQMTVLERETAVSFAEAKTETEQLPEPEMVFPSPPDVIEEVIEEQPAPKPKSKRAKRPPSSRSARTGKSKPRSSKERSKEGGVSKASPN